MSTRSKRVKAEEFPDEDIHFSENLHVKYTEETSILAFPVGTTLFNITTDDGRHTTTKFLDMEEVIKPFELSYMIEHGINTALAEFINREARAMCLCVAVNGRAATVTVWAIKCVNPGVDEHFLFRTGVKTKVVEDEEYTAVKANVPPPVLVGRVEPWDLPIIRPGELAERLVEKHSVFGRAAIAAEDQATKLIHGHPSRIVLVEERCTPLDHPGIRRTTITLYYTL